MGLPVGSLRRSLPQILASTAKNFILFDNGLVLSMPTIVIAALLGNAADPLQLSPTQASWFASISYLCQPLGSIFSGYALEPLGRKKSMIALNIPYLTGWTLLYFADNIASLYAAGAIMGFAVGCSEAPILTYVGEVSEPSLRGILTSYAQLFGSLAYVALYLIGSLTTWRNTAAACAIVPIITVVAIAMVPETPIWLISRGRQEDAEKALCWLRGWTKPLHIRKEFDQLLEYHRTTESQKYGKNSELLTDKKMTFMDSVKDFCRPELRRPLIIIIIYFFFYYASGLACIRPYLIPVFEKLGTTKDPYKATVDISTAGFVGNAVCMLGVFYSGKRLLTFISLLGCAVCTLGVALVSMEILDIEYSFWFLVALSFFTGIGVAPIPWMLQSEMYPFRGKSLAAGIAAAVSYVIGFFATKTYLWMEEALTLPGVFVLYTVMSVVGALYLYFYLPETEGRTLEAIEADFTK